MSNRKHHLLASLLIVVLTCGTVVVFAAPIGTRQQTLPGPIRSLEGIESVRLLISESPIVLSKAEVSRSYIEGRTSQMLKEAGIRVTDDVSIDIPVLTIKTSAVTEPKVGAAHAYIMELELMQPVNIARINKSLVVPTFSIEVVGLERTTELTGPARANVGFLINQFINAHQAANKAGK